MIYNFPVMVEKGVVFDIRRYSVHDGPGIRTTVFLKGCPLKCQWCHNPEGISTRPQFMKRSRLVEGKENHYEEKVGRMVSSSEVIDTVLRDRLFYEESGGGVTFSGGEPMMQPDFLLNLLSLCIEEGVHTAVDTSGYANEAVFLKIADKAQLLLFDLKSTDNDLHRKYTGVNNELIWNNLRKLSSEGPEVIIRIPVVPGFNSKRSDVALIRDGILELNARIQRVDILPYHRLGRHKYEALGMEVPPTFQPAITDDEINDLVQVFVEAGLNAKQGG
jgi:pyruvate formate lyase activating enzyme